MRFVPKSMNSIFPWEIYITSTKRNMKLFLLPLALLTVSALADAPAPSPSESKDSGKAKSELADSQKKTDELKATSREDSRVDSAAVVAAKKKAVEAEA